MKQNIFSKKRFVFTYETLCFSARNTLFCREKQSVLCSLSVRNKVFHVVLYNETICFALGNAHGYQSVSSE